MIVLSIEQQGVANSVGAKELVIRIDNSEGCPYIIPSGIFMPTRFLIDGKINFFKKRTSSTEELASLSALRDQFEKIYDKVYNIVRVSEGYLSEITDSWINDILVLDCHGKIKKMGEWMSLVSILNADGHKVRATTPILGSRQVFDYFKQYEMVNSIELSTKQANSFLARLLVRFMFYKRIVCQQFSFDLSIDTLSSKDLDDFKSYALQEGDLYASHKPEYELILEITDKLIPSTKTHIPKNLHQSRIIILLRKLKAVFVLLLKTKETINNPFEKYEIGDIVLNRIPICLQKRELAKVKNLSLVEGSSLARQRDVFVFQCLTGCRYRDLIQLTAENVKDGKLEYQPRPTVKENYPAEPVIYLESEAISLIQKYDGSDWKHRLFPFTLRGPYERALKEILRLSGINRRVFVHNSREKKEDFKPLYETADCNLALSTYHYLNQEEQVIEVTTSIPPQKRTCKPIEYRGIDDDILMAAIKLIE